MKLIATGNKLAGKGKNILLVDDMVDSKWTFTVCGYRLMENRAEKVFPFALADSSRNEV